MSCQPTVMIHYDVDHSGRPPRWKPD